MERDACDPRVGLCQDSESGCWQLVSSVSYFVFFSGKQSKHTMQRFYDAVSNDLLKKWHHSLGILKSGQQVPIMRQSGVSNPPSSTVSVVLVG